MSLDVHLHGERVGSLRRSGDGYSLAYDPEAVERLGPQRARLSLSLPPRAEPHGPAATRAYVEGLLPQGARR
jgi:HipA-like protein